MWLVLWWKQKKNTLTSLLVVGRAGDVGVVVQLSGVMVETTKKPSAMGERQEKPHQQVIETDGLVSWWKHEKIHQRVVKTCWWLGGLAMWVEEE
jgi:hypothetical protein